MKRKGYHVIYGARGFTPDRLNAMEFCSNGLLRLFNVQRREFNRERWPKESAFFKGYHVWSAEDVGMLARNGFVVKYW